MLSLFSRNRPSARTAARTQVTRTGLKPQLESLERRQMFAADLPFSFAWVDDANSLSSTPDPTFSHNTAGDSIEVNRLSQGRYVVEFNGVAAGQTDGGNVQVSPYGGGFTSCTVNRWVAGDTADDVAAFVNCFDAAGNLTDSQFNVALMYPDTSASIAYAWGHSPWGAGPQLLNADYAHNPAGGDVDLTRGDVGSYTVRFHDMASLGSSPGGNVQVTPYGNAAVSATVRSWGPSGDDLLVNVRTTDDDGNPVDAEFSLAVIPPGTEPDSVGFAWAGDADSNETLDANSYAHNPAADGIQKTRLSEGYYRVTFDDFNPTEDWGGHVVASSYGSGSHTGSGIQLGHV